MQHFAKVPLTAQAMLDKSETFHSQWIGNEAFESVYTAAMKLQQQQKKKKKTHTAEATGSHVCRSNTKAQKQGTSRKSA